MQKSERPALFSKSIPTKTTNVFGDTRSHFIKVSHHGSRDSSSDYLWQSILPMEGSVFLGTSAGRHSGFKHAHSETMLQIRKKGVDAIF